MYHDIRDDWLILQCNTIISEEHVRHTSKRAVQSRQDALLNYYIERKETAANFIFGCTILFLLSSFQNPEVAPHISERLAGFCFEFFKKSSSTYVSNIKHQCISHSIIVAYHDNIPHIF